MGGVQSVFKGIVGERIVTSFDFLDIVKGKAIQRFYAGTALETGSATKKYILNDGIFWSEDLKISCGVGGSVGSPTLISTTDFDVDMQTTRIIRGGAISTISFGITDSRGYGCSLYIKMYVKKVSGTTTTLQSAKSDTITLGSVASGSALSTLYFDVPKTHFKIGDILRLCVEMWATNADTGAGINVHFGCDPYNSTVAGISATRSILDIYIPFNIDL